MHQTGAPYTPEPMEKLRGLNKLVMETEESKEISKLYTQLTAALEEYERDTIDKWVKAGGINFVTTFVTTPVFTTLVATLVPLPLPFLSST